MKTNRFSHLIIIFCFSLSACGQTTGNRNVDFFKETKAYDLAKAVYASDISKIEKLVKSDTSLLSFCNPTSGSNVLELCLYVEQFESFKKLLELGANPNFINPVTRYSVLIDAFKYYYKPQAYKVDLRYVQSLLTYGANPNYVVEEDFTNAKGHHILATSPLIEASLIDLEMVKLLIKNGADLHHKIKQDQSTPFSKAVQRGNIDIINYYIDSLHIDIFQPMSVVIRQPDNNEVIYYLQDYLVNKYSLARLKGDNDQIEKLTKQNKGIEETNKELWDLILRLEKMGIDFKNYEYKLK